MTRTVIPFNSQHIVYDSPLSFDVVQARLYAEVNKTSDTVNIIAEIKEAETQEDFLGLMQQFAGPSGLGWFGEIHHEVLMKLLTGGPVPANVLYTIGNPALAQRLVAINQLSALNFPPRFLISEKANNTGVFVYYQLPSSLLSNPFGQNDPLLQDALDELDLKYHNLAENITCQEN